MGRWHRRGRKVYELTDAGDDLLAFWIDRFEEEQAGVARFLNAVRTTVRARARKQQRPKGRAS